jgi:hypothetical protein
MSKYAADTERAGDGERSAVEPQRCEALESLLEPGNGLASCAGRVEAVGGCFEISQNGTGGTRVRAVVPETSS